ncbi:MAG: thioredoxin [Dehalococcoidia bacterium]|nr:thioredoxin [Dehalococcoidia bacterium]
MVQNIVGEDDFQKKVLDSKVPAWIDFWAQWCAPCLAAAPLLEDLAAEYEGRVNFFKVNVDENNSVARKYGIAAIPTMLVFKEGRPVRQVVGYKAKREFKKILDEVLAE